MTTSTKTLTDISPLPQTRLSFTATGWGARRDEGGLLWAAYKATTKRFGVFTGASGPRDFNAELFEPISKHLAGAWERVFQRRLPAVLNGYLGALKRLLKSFHQEVVEGAQEKGIAYAGLSMLEQQAQTNIHLIDGIPSTVLGIAQELQRTANRNFTPVIQDKMDPAYDASNNEHGMSSSARVIVTVSITF